MHGWVQKIPQTQSPCLYLCCFWTVCLSLSASRFHNVCQTTSPGTWLQLHVSSPCEHTAESAVTSALTDKGAHFWLLCHLQPHKAASTIRWAARAQREPCLTTEAQCITLPSPHPRQWVTGLNGGARMRVTSIWLSMSSSSSPTTALHNGTHCHHLHFLSLCSDPLRSPLHTFKWQSGQKPSCPIPWKCLQVRIACA